MKKLQNIKEALIITIIAIVLIWVMYPITVLLSYPIHADGHPRFSWLETAIAGLILTATVITYFVIFAICKLKRRNFDVKIYEIKNISYEKFLDEYINQRNNYELEYDKFLIYLDNKNGVCSYQIYNDNTLVEEKTFSDQSELLNSKILAGQTLKDLWQYIYSRKIN